MAIKQGHSLVARWGIHGCIGIGHLRAPESSPGIHRMFNRGHRGLAIFREHGRAVLILNAKACKASGITLPDTLLKETKNAR